MEEVVIGALAAWAVAWVLTFWTKMEWLRERAGVGYDRDAQGNPIDRWPATRLGEWLNCPHCCAVIGSVVVVSWWVVGLPWRGMEALAMLGLAVLIVRWWEGARVKAEWWI